jgi:hypothetical protein
MTIETSVLLGASSLAVAGLVWLVRLEGRVNLGEQETRNLKGDIDEIKADVKTLIRMNGKRSTDVT